MDRGATSRASRAGVIVVYGVFDKPLCHARQRWTHAVAYGLQLRRHVGIYGGDTLSHAALVRVDDVMCFRELDLGAADPGQVPGDLSYLLFGDADHDLFLAHQIGHRPSFDQVLRIAADGVHFTEAEIDRQLRPEVAIPGRTDSPGERLKAGEVVAAHSSAGMHFQNDLQVSVLAEIYSNEDELR